MSRQPPHTTEPAVPQVQAVVNTRNPLRRLYDWVLGWASSPFAIPALFTIAFVESSFFPIPPDVLLIALALSVPARAFRYAAWCTVGSVLGGMFGYLLGYALWSTVEPWLIPAVFSRDTFELVRAKYQQHGELAVFVAAFTPIPYKVFTVAAGVAELDMPGFVGASIVGRGARFFLVAFVIRLTGERAKQLLDRYLNIITIVFTLLLIGGFAAIRVLK